MYRYNPTAATIREEEDEYLDDEYLDAMVTPRIENLQEGIAVMTAGVEFSSAVVKQEKHPEHQRDEVEAQIGVAKQVDKEFPAKIYQQHQLLKEPPRFTLDWYFWTMSGMTIVFLALIGYGFGSGLYLPNKKSISSGQEAASSNAASSIAGMGSSMQPGGDPSSASQMDVDQSETNRQDYKSSLLDLFGLSLTMERTSPQARAIDWLAFDDEPLLLEETSMDAYQQQQRLTQRYALVVWYFAQGGPNLWSTLNRDAGAGWIEHGTGIHECEWTGVKCDDGDNIEELHLSPINGLLMTGSSVSTELGLLTDLRRIDFSDQRLQGKIPDEWSQLTNLELVVLSQNQLQSTIPEWIGGWTNLQRLYLDGNLLYGTIPSSVATLQNLEHLELQENSQLRGRFDVLFSNASSTAIMDGVGLQESLRYLDLSNTDLEGELPEITLSALTFLRLWNTNGFGGTLPSQIGTWSNLEYFSIKENPKLVGSIPTEFGLLQNLKTLEVLESNFMSGTLPTELGNLSSNLKIINFRYNNQTGSLPLEWSNIAGLQLLDVSTNRLEGKVPPEYSKLTKLRFMDLRGTRLTGEVPQAMCDLSSREEFLADCATSNENSNAISEMIQCACCVWCTSGNSYGN